MKKQILIIGITLVLIIVGFSGCEEQDENREGIRLQNPNFYLNNNIVMNNCNTINQTNGTIWVNFTVTNMGGGGYCHPWARVYYDTEGYQSCGDGTVYNQTQYRSFQLLNNQSEVVSFVFTGINCANSGCYIFEYGPD
jgi:hypothetical protein